jgi:receptor expression-enhancing protein 1/2/3/4
MLRIPLYSYIRLLFLLYLVLPQTQGARVIYTTYIHPYLEENETQIEELIATTHDKMKAAGIAYLKRAIEAVRTQVLGLPPNPAAQQAESNVPASQRPRSYTQALLDRFQLPQAQWSGNAGGTTGQDFYNFLSNAVNAATAAVVATDSNTAASDKQAASASRGPGVGAFPTGDLSASGTLVPPNIQGNADKMSFLAAQRERLNYVLSALDREAAQLRSGAAAAPGGEQEISLEGLQPGGGSGERPTTSSSGKSTGGLSKSRSEVDFEKIEAESGAEDNTQESAQATPGPSGASWLPWQWSASSSDAGKNKSE